MPSLSKLFRPLVFLSLLLITRNDPGFATGWVDLSVNNQRIKAEIVSSTAEQKLGLGNRDSLPIGNGMLFIYKQPGEKIFWMKRMRFAIDIIWILQGKIVHIEKNVPPPTVLSANLKLKTYGHGITADMVLEVPNGYTDQIKLKPGDAVHLLP